MTHKSERTFYGIDGDVGSRDGRDVHQGEGDSCLYVAEEQLGDGDIDVVYVSARMLSWLREQLRQGGGSITRYGIEKLFATEALEDDELLIPVNLTVATRGFCDMDELVAELGLDGAAAAFVGAAGSFGPPRLPGGPRSPEPMTAGAWRRELEEADAAEREQEPDEDEDPAIARAVRILYGDGDEDDVDDQSENAQKDNVGETGAAPESARDPVKLRSRL